MFSVMLSDYKFFQKLKIKIVKETCNIAKDVENICDTNVVQFQVLNVFKGQQ